MKAPVYKWLIVVIASVVLVGCGSSGKNQDLHDYITETKRRPAGQIEPLPAFRPYQAFTYAAVALRSPFERPVAELASNPIRSGVKVKPDLTREKEYLERFNFTELSMVGTVLKDEVLWALISDGNNVHRVSRGNFLGKNHGRIVQTSMGQLDIVEIVPDGLDGWVERPRAIKLVEKE